MRQPDNSVRLGSGCINASTAYQPAPVLVAIPPQVEAPTPDRLERAEAMLTMHNNGHTWRKIADAYGYRSTSGPGMLIRLVLR